MRLFQCKMSSVHLPKMRPPNPAASAVLLSGSKYWQALNLHAPLQDSLYGDRSKFCTSESSTPGLPFLKFCPFHQRFLEASSLENTPSHNKPSLPPQKYPAPLQSQDVKGASSNFSPYLSAASWCQILS